MIVNFTTKSVKNRLPPVDIHNFETASVSASKSFKALYRADILMRKSQSK